MPTFCFVLEYDGTAFAGWQAQKPGVRTLQGTFEAAIAEVTGNAIRVVAAGRTDAGVHAEGQVVSARLDTRLTPPDLARALNAVLPPDLAVRSVAEAAPEFHALRAARGKLYRYHVWNGPVRSPLRLRTHHWIRAPLDLDALRRASAPLVGRHDFAAYETRARENGDPDHGTIRTLVRVGIDGDPGEEVRLEFEGQGFLRYMVRTLVGTLLEVGRGVRAVDDPARVLAVRDRRLAGPTVPAHGLVLVRVDL